MVEEYKLYPNGFIFSSNIQNNVPNYYSKIDISKSYKYYYDPIYGDNFLCKNDQFIILHGHFAYISPETFEVLDKDSLLEDLLQNYYNDYNNFLDMLDYLGGRYCLLIGNSSDYEVFQDASGARSFYYALDNDIVASHANLIKDNIKTRPYSFGQKTTYPRFSFHNSPFENVKALLPNFKYTHSKKDITRFFPRSNNRYNHLKDNIKVNTVEKLWKAQLKYYKNEYKNLLISITGGNDSRISLALSRQYKEELKYFTYCKNPENINKSIKRETVNEKDRIIVEKILENIKLNHTFVYYDDNELEINQKLNYTLSKNSIAKHGRFLLNLYLLNFPEENIMHLRGTCLEIVQSVYVNPRIDCNNEQAVLKRYLQTAEKFYKLLPEKEFEQVGQDGIRKLGYDLKQYDFEVLDLYYWEHRMGRWHPELLNETDTAFDTFLPFNLRSILEIGMSFSIEKRQSGYLFKELINNSFPILNFYGVNNVKNIYEQHKATINGETQTQKIVNDIRNINYVSQYNIFDSRDNINYTQKANNNVLKIPLKSLNKNSYSEFIYSFKNKNGILQLTLKSPYYNLDAKGVLNYQVLVNDKIVLEEDMSLWKFNNNINLFNLRLSDEITVRILSNNDLTRPSWERATRLEIIEIQEQDELDRPSIENSVSCTSPFSIIY